jgi:hypothetical protein
MMLTIIIYSNLIYLMGNFCCVPSKSNLSNPKKVCHLHLDYYYSMRKKGLRRNRSRRMMLSRRRWSTLMTTPPLLTLAVLIFWRMILQWLRRRNIITMNKHIMIYLWQVLDQFVRIIRAFNCQKKNTKCSRNIRNWTLKRSLRQWIQMLQKMLPQLTSKIFHLLQIKQSSINLFQPTILDPIILKIQKARYLRLSSFKKNSNKVRPSRKSGL